MSAGASANTTRNIIITPVENIRARGDLVDRMKLAIQCLDKASDAELWNGFTTGMWGADWPGRTLEAYSRVSLSLGQECTSRFDEVGDGLLQRQSPDGAFHNGKANADYDKGVGFWFGNARGMLGLLWAHRYRGQAKYLSSAKRLGDYYIKKYFDDDQPGSDTRDHFWWVGTEALLQLYLSTSDAKYLRFAQKVADTVKPVNSLSQHTHSYLLALRGILQIYEQSGRQKYLDMVMEQRSYFNEHVMWPGGGIIEHLGDPSNQTMNYWFDEGCSVCDWLGLNLDLWRITRETKYMDMVERIALNHLLYDQDASGGFCGDRGIDFVREGSPWRFCCAMHGTRTLSEITQYIAMTDGKNMYVNLFYPSTTKLTISKKLFTIEQETDYPDDGWIKIKCNSMTDMRFAMNIRVPAWSKVQEMLINGKSYRPIVKKGYLVIEREWKDADTLNFRLDLPLRNEKRNRFIGDTGTADYSLVSLWKGPRQLVYNQQLNNHLWEMANARPALRYSYQSYEQLSFDKSCKATPLRIGKKTYKKGIGTHSVSEIVYALGKKFKEFRADIGIDEVAGNAGTVRFKVCVDGVVKAGEAARASMQDDANTVDSLYGFKVAAVSGKDNPKSIVVNVEGANVLRLYVDEAVNGLEDDVADWADARLIAEDGTVVYLSDLPDDRKLGLPWDWGTVKLKELKESGREHVTTLAYEIGNKTVPVRFNYLADLGYSLIQHRPVLHNWMKAE